MSYAAALDVEGDVEVARRAGLEESSCATLRVCTMLVKAALRAHGKALEGKGGAVTSPCALAGMLMRQVFDAPSPLEVMCARALGMEEAAAQGDTALIDHVTHVAREQQGQQEQQGQREQQGQWESSEQREGKKSASSEPNAPADFSPPAEFYERFAALLEETFEETLAPPPEVA